MRTYTLHLPEGALRGDPRALDRAHLVPDGFSWAAYGFSVLWFLRHRLWLAALLVLALLVGLAVLGRLLGLPAPAGLVVTGLALVLVGLEASSLRRWTYGRRGLPARDAVVAGSTEEAEAKALARWLDPSAARAAPRPGASVGRRLDESVIGVFPASEAGR